MNPRIIPLALSVERAARRGEELWARRTRPTRVLDLPLTSPAGHPLPCRLHLPQGEGPFPAILFCPGGLDGARGAEGLSTVLTAPRLARAGYATLVWTPSGREGVAGPEDRNGPLHQEEAVRALSALLEHPQVDRHRVGVLSISFGVALAVGALTRRPDLGAQVRFLLDWEGPPSRRWFQVSRLRYWTPEDPWWAPREAARGVGRLPCRYWRYQSAWDHVHGADVGIAEEMVAAALAGGAPEVRLNGRPGAERPATWGPILLRAQAQDMLRMIASGLE